jgi:hypothetical protein
MLGRQSFFQNLVLIGQGVLSRRTLEKLPFPLKASIAYTTLPCANALAYDDAFSAKKMPLWIQILHHYYVQAR